MIPPRELAAQLAGSILDHVERERNLVRHSIEEVIYDALLLAQAKARTPTPMTAGAASQELRDAVIRMISVVARDSMLRASIPQQLLIHIEHVNEALVRTSWRP